MSKSRGSDAEHDHVLQPTEEELRLQLAQSQKKSLRGFRCAGVVNLEAAEWVKSIRKG